MSTFNNKSKSELIEEIESLKKQVRDFERIKETLSENEEKYKALYNNAPLSYQSLNEDGCFIDVNPAWLRTLGFKREEVIGKWFGDFLHPDWKQHFEKNFPEFKRRGYVHDVQFKIRHNDGHYLEILFEGCIGYTPDGKFKQTYCVFQDITERKRAEEALLMKNYAVASSINGIGITDLKGTMIYVNEAAVKIWGYKSNEEIIGRSLPEFWEGDGIYKTIEALEKKGFRFGEDMGKRKDGSPFPVQFSASIVKDNEGNPKYIFGSFIDITERKQAEEVMRQYEHIVSSSTDMMALLDKQFTYLAANSAYVETFNLIPEELIGNKVADVFGNEFFNAVIKPNAERCMRGEEVNFQGWYDFPTNKKCYMDINYYPYYGEDYKIVGFAVNGRNITARKEAEEKLISRNKELEIFNNVTVGRELKMIELKKEINELLEKAGEKPKYKLPV